MQFPYESDGFKTYLFSYSHEGAEWCLEIKARDMQDAKARLARLPFARYDGELYAVIPASAGWLARLIVFVRNRLGL